MTYRTLIATLAAEHRSRHEGAVPPRSQILLEPWVPAYLRVMFPVPARPLEPDTLCACGHAASEHPLQGGCAACGCAAYQAIDTREEPVCPAS